MEKNTTPPQFIKLDYEVGLKVYMANQRMRNEKKRFVSYSETIESLFEPKK
jgi:hypothetical protein